MYDAIAFNRTSIFGRRRIPKFLTKDNFPGLSGSYRNVMTVARGADVYNIILLPYLFPGLRILPSISLQSF